MNKVAHYLQEHLLGEVSTSVDARAFFSTDQSIFTITPSVIVYPRNENDVRKTARFTWQLAERGRVIPMTARGAGTDMSGAAVGEGIVLSFPAHMNRIVQLDPKNGDVTVEPGLNYGRLQQTLHTHDRFLPPFPMSIEYSTLGGAVGNNATGKYGLKYGATLDYVKSLRVVLANGDVIVTKRLTKRELGKKLGLTNFEGDIYRALDSLIEEKREIVEGLSKSELSRNTAGYNLADVKHKDGSFDLTPLFVGSQGTLGIISEITLSTETYNPESTVFLASFDSIDSACEAILDLRALPELPSGVELIDGNLLSFVDRLNPNQLKDSLEKPYPRIALMVEFDDTSERRRKRATKRAKAIFERLATSYREETALPEQIKLLKVRQSVASLLSHSEKRLRPIPLIDDAVVPPERMADAIKIATSLFAREQLQLAIWGHAGQGMLQVHPFFDIGALGDRQRAFRLLQQYYDEILKLGGSTSGQHNDGRLRGPLLEKVYGKDGLAVLQKVKKIFDPHGTLNPGVKTDATLESAKQQLRNDYTFRHLYDYMPRS